MENREVGVITGSIGPRKTITRAQSALSLKQLQSVSRAQDEQEDDV